MEEFESAAVIEGDESVAVADATRRPKPRGAPKWETEARDRLKAAIRRYSRPSLTWWRVTPTNATTAAAARYGP